FEITKRGTGKAVLANIGANMANGNCPGLTALDPGPRKNGSECYMASDCESGVCGKSPVPTTHPLGWFDNVCLGCDMTHGCASGETCGIGDPTLPILPEPVQCVPIGTRELGERCSTPAECASGICSLNRGSTGVCSACSSAATCPASQQCADAWAVAF